MNKILIASVIVIVLIGGGFYFYQRSLSQPPEDKVMRDETVMQDDEVVSDEEEVIEVEGYTGKVLAGRSSPLLEFKREDYEKALQDGKIVFLYFYANWCPICRIERPIILKGFNSITSDQIVGFQVNFNDTDTDEDESALAKEFSVPYQHTKIFLKDGREVSRSPIAWESQDFQDEFSQILQ